LQASMRSSWWLPHGVPCTGLRAASLGACLRRRRASSRGRTPTGRPSTKCRSWSSRTPAECERFPALMSPFASPRCIFLHLVRQTVVTESVGHARLAAFKGPLQLRFHRMWRRMRAGWAM
jgi:hypothetical protein